MIISTDQSNWVQSLLYHPLILDRPIASATGKAIKFSPLRNYYIQGFISGLTYTFLGLGFGFGKDWFIKERKNLMLEREKASAELSLLRNQLNPHFLFNTINDIYYLAIIHSDKTSEALLKLSDILRYVLHQKDEWVALDEEIHYLKKFIELHQFRFPKDVIQLDFEQLENAGDYRIPPMLLITFIENVFKHGYPGVEEEPVKVSIRMTGNKLCYEVINKIGHVQSKDSSSGIGIPNLRKRLQLIYPDKHLIQFDEKDGNFIAYLELEIEK